MSRSSPAILSRLHETNSALIHELRHRSNWSTSGPLHIFCHSNKKRLLGLEPFLRGAYIYGSCFFPSATYLSMPHSDLMTVTSHRYPKCILNTCQLQNPTTTTVSLFTSYTCTFAIVVYLYLTLPGLYSSASLSVTTSGDCCRSHCSQDSSSSVWTWSASQRWW